MHVSILCTIARSHLHIQAVLRRFHQRLPPYCDRCTTCTSAARHLQSSNGPACRSVGWQIFKVKRPAAACRLLIALRLGAVFFTSASGQMT